jgi:DNA-binding XRE family transcriptional regulator
MNTLAETIMLMRKRLGIKSSEFAKKHSISRATLWRIENGKSSSMPLSLVSDLLSHQKALSRAEVLEEAIRKLGKLESIFIDWDDEDRKNFTVTPVVKRTDVTGMLLSLKQSLSDTLAVVDEKLHKE